MALSLQDLDFVAIWVGNEGHFDFGARRESFSPVLGPDFDAVFFQLVTIGHDVFDSDSCVHEVFGEFDFEVGRVAKLQEVLVSVEFQERELVASRGLVCAASQFEAHLLVELDSLIKIADTDSSVEEFDHG